MADPLVIIRAVFGEMSVSGGMFACSDCVSSESEWVGDGGRVSVTVRHEVDCAWWQANVGGPAGVLFQVVRGVRVSHWGPYQDGRTELATVPVGVPSLPARQGRTRYLERGPLPLAECAGECWSDKKKPTRVPEGANLCQSCRLRREMSR